MLRVILTHDTEFVSVDSVFCLRVAPQKSLIL